MKVLIVSYLLDPRIGGGAATSALRLCQGLVAQGVEVVAVATHNEPQPRTTEEYGFRVHYFRPRNLYWVADKDQHSLPERAVWQIIDTWNPHVYRQLRRIIDRERPDVVHVHKLRGLSPAVWTAAAAENRHPIIQTCRDYEAVSPEGQLESTVGRMALRRHWALRPYQAARAHWSRAVDVATAPSRFTLEIITGLGFFPEAQPIVVPNTHGYHAAELPRGPASAVPPPGDTFRFLYLGRLETTKGIDLLLKAFTQIAADIPYAHLDIAGTGTRAEALRRQYGAHPQVRFHGYLAGDAKDQIIAQADMLLMPSIYREVFGNSIIEAYAFGKPVLAARVGGMPELVRPGQTGALVEPDDVDALGRALCKLAAAPQRVRAMGAACITAAHDYTLEAVTNGYLQAYEAARRQADRRADTNRKA